MAQLPMWGPNPGKSGPSPTSDGLWISPEELAADVPAAPGCAPESDLAELAAKFAAHSGGGFSKELSADLALEIVLNEIVEQACLATGATGAAIVLDRDGEFVCRASAGATAPELGVRLDTETGLSGACVKTRQIQRCDDAQTDPRADMDASRSLGVRSVMILPLVRNNKLAGVFEVFSSRPAAFGERDQRTLEVLAYRTLKNLQRASEPLTVSPPVMKPAEAPQVVKATEAPATERTVAASEPRVVATEHRVAAPEHRVAPAETRRRDEWEPTYPAEALPSSGTQFDGVTLVLAVIVFACAVLLSTLVGLHFGRQASVDRVHKVNSKSRVASKMPPQNLDLANSNAPAFPARASNSGPTAASPSLGGPAPIGQSVGTSATASRGVVPPAGSLLIYENGKEVYRMLPAAKKNANGAVERASAVEAAPGLELPPEVAESSLIRRVEPDYPEDARRRGIQGPVVLDLRIAQDGAVEDVSRVSGQTLLADAAISAVKQWRFKPHLVAGREVEMQTRITLRFALPKP